jgi:hypothetical protein
MDPLVDKSTKPFDVKYLRLLCKIDKLAWQIEAQQTTLSDEQKRIEELVQDMARQYPEIERSVIPPLPYTWPVLPKRLKDAPVDYPSIRHCLIRRRSAWLARKLEGQLEITKRELVFDMFELAKALNIRGLMNLCATQINHWRSSAVSIFCRDWNMMIDTRWERVGSMEVVVQVHLFVQRYRTYKRNMLVWTNNGKLDHRKPEGYEMEDSCESLPTLSAELI